MFSLRYLEPVCPLFLAFRNPKQGLFQSKQGSFGFQVYIQIYIHNIFHCFVTMIFTAECHNSSHGRPSSKSPRRKLQRDKASSWPVSLFDPKTRKTFLEERTYSQEILKISHSHQRSAVIIIIIIIIKDQPSSSSSSKISRHHHHHHHHQSSLMLSNALKNLLALGRRNGSSVDCGHLKHHSNMMILCAAHHPQSSRFTGWWLNDQPI